MRHILIFDDFWGGYRIIDNADNTISIFAYELSELFSWGLNSTTPLDNIDSRHFRSIFECNSFSDFIEKYPEEFI